MARRDQVKPLAPVEVHRPRSDEDEVLFAQFKLRQRKYLKCCGCVAALFLILAVVSLILAFTGKWSIVDALIHSFPSLLFHSGGMFISLS